MISEGYSPSYLVHGTGIVPRIPTLLAPRSESRRTSIYRARGTPQLLTLYSI